MWHVFSARCTRSADTFITRTNSQLASPPRRTKHDVHRSCQLELRVLPCLFFVVIIRTRSRVGRAPGGVRGATTILCVRAVELQRSGPVACSPSRNLAPPFHNCGTMEGATKKWALCCFVSCWYLHAGTSYLLHFLRHRKIELRYEPSGTTVPHTTSI